METFLVCPGIKINVLNKDGETPLNLAVIKGLVEMVEILLADIRIDVNKPNTVGNQNALVIASEIRHITLVKLLLSHNQTLVNQLNANKESALQVALQKYKETGLREHFRPIKVLLRCPKTKRKTEIGEK